MNFLDCLSLDELKLLRIKEYKTLQMVKNEGSICNEIGILISGKLIISTITYGDKEEIINTVKEGEIFGEFLIHAKNNQYLGNIYAIQNSKIAFLTKNNLLKVLRNNEDALNYYLENLSNDALKIKQQAKMLSHKNIGDRMLYYFYTNANNNVYILDSVQALANRLSLPRPSVSRELINLEKKGIISRIDKKIILKEE